MLRTTTIAACVLALGTSLAFAQTASQYNTSGGVMPPGASTPSYGTTGAAPLRDVGSPTANATNTAGGGTHSSSMLSQRIKNESAAGMSSSSGEGMAVGSYAQPMPAPQPAMQYDAPQQAYSGGMVGDNANPSTVCITDEYGRKYNCRGDRISGRIR